MPTDPLILSLSKETERSGRTALVLGPTPAFPPAPGSGPILILTRDEELVAHERRGAAIAAICAAAERLLERISITAGLCLLGYAAHAWLCAIGVEP